MTNKHSHKLSALALAVALASAGTVVHADEKAATSENTVKQSAQNTWDSTKQSAKSAQRYTESATRNAWRHGKLETAFLLNRHLNNFTIDSRVDGDTAYLAGKVESDIDRDLAEQIALGIDGIETVQNDLVVESGARDAERPQGEERTFADRVSDATTTASVKSRLLVNGNTSGMKIDVDTRDSVVTLSGSVQSSEEKALAERIARNTADVRSVENKLEVSAARKG